MERDPEVNLLQKMKNNTIIRSLSGSLFLIIMTGSMFISPVVFAMVLLFATLVMIKEFLSISVGRAYRSARVFVMAAATTLFTILYLNARYGVSANFFWIIAIPLTAIYAAVLFDKDSRSNNPQDCYKCSSFLFMSLIYIALPFSLLNTILFTNSGEYNPYPLLALFILLWSSDVGAYVFGMAFGQKNGHKLFPSVSPKKSWEGFFGGLITSLIAGITIYYTKITEFSLTLILSLSVTVFLAGVLGDLAESLFKRNFDVKDSGSIMPGHGGLLDRFDGALIAFPLSMAIIKIFT